MNEKDVKNETHDTLLATIESTADQIFKIPATSSDLMVTGAALIALIILASYMGRLFKRSG